MSWDIKPTFNVGKTEILPSVKGKDAVVEKIRLALDNPNWTLEGELIKAQKRKETGESADAASQNLINVIMSDPGLVSWFGGSEALMQLFGAGTRTEAQGEGDILKLGGSYTFDNDFKISPSLERDLLTQDTTYGLGLTKDGFSADLGYDEGLTGSVAYGPVRVGSTGDGARLDLNKNIKEFYDTEGRTTGGLNIKGFYDTEGNWRVGPTFSMTFGGQDDKPSYEGTSLAELQEALQKEKLYAKGGLAHVLGV